MAMYTTEVQPGGSQWESHGPIYFGANSGLTPDTLNVPVPGGGEPETGTTVTWDNSTGNGNVTFFDGGDRFEGTAVFPGEGPVGYRGQRAL